jgi:hypothetical protein
MASQYSFSGLCPLLYARCSLFILSWRSLYFLFLGGGGGSPLLHDIIEFDVRSSSAHIFLIKYQKLGCFLPTSVFHLLLNAENIPAKSMMWNVSFFLSHTKRHACPDAINLRIFLNLRIFSTPMDIVKCSNIIGWKQKFWEFPEQNIYFMAPGHGLSQTNIVVLLRNTVTIRLFSENTC